MRQTDRFAKSADGAGGGVDLKVSEVAESEAIWVVAIMDYYGDEVERGSL